jgi:hypothetical protein
VNVGGGTAMPVAWFVDGARAFLDVVAADLRGKKPKYARSVHLVALPVVGTGRGGAKHRAGDVVKELLPLLEQKAAEHAIDIALVAIDEPTYASAQSERKTRAKAHDGWRDLDGHTRKGAEDLADRAASGSLVLFLGAGVSVGAGLPSWGELLERMAEPARLSNEERAQLAKFDAMDQASILKSRIEALTDSRDFRAEIVRLARGAHASLSHSLLSALPVEEIVTTNYDELFELASTGIGHRVSVLPHAPDELAKRWLLKMHGCVSRPADIVLTREDFLRYEHRRAALAGIVQALLLTKHMLFVGFSLRDENFHRIADAVRRARGARHLQKKLGTVVRIESDPLLETLWKDDLAFLHLTDPRRLEIFLDYLLASTRPPLSHVLDPRYSGTLSEPERALRERLSRFLADVPADAKRGPAWDEVAKLVARLGGTPS